MPAALAFFDSDGTTPLASFFYGLVPPGSSFFAQNSEYKQLVVKNVGDVDLTGVSISIVPFGSRDGSENVRIATGDTPGSFFDSSDPPLALGDLDVDETANVWVDIIEPIDGELQQNKGWTFNLTGAPVSGS